MVAPHEAHVQRGYVSGSRLVLPGAGVEESFFERRAWLRPLDPWSLGQSRLAGADRVLIDD